MATNFFAQPPPSFSDPYATPRIPGYQESYIPSRDASVGVQSSSAATSDRYNRWCFLCKDDRPFTTLNSFRRHAAEHLTEYRCIPHDLVSSTEHGPVCVYCSVSISDSGHLGTHISKCIGKKYTRLNALKDHLRNKHNIRHGSILAEQFKYNIIEQKHFACGFCVLYCGSLNELVSHVDARHYRCSEHISDWDNNNAIRGLLRQPVIIDYWQRLLAANRLEGSYFTWNPTDAKKLRERLEMSAESAEILFRVAIDKSNYGAGQHGHFESMPITGLADLGRYTNPSNRTFQRDRVLSPLSYAPEPEFTTHVPRMTAPDSLNNLDRDAIYENRPLPQNNLEMFGSPTGAMGYDADPRLQPLDSPDRSESFMNLHQHPAYLSSTASAGSVSQSLEGQPGISHNLRLTGYLPGLSPKFSTDPRSRAHADFVYPTLPTQVTPSPLSRNRGTSSLAHHSTYNPGHRPIIAAQSPHPEMTDGHGNNTEFDSDNEQHFMQLQDHSQRQRR